MSSTNPWPTLRKTGLNEERKRKDENANYLSEEKQNALASMKQANELKTAAFTERQASKAADAMFYGQQEQFGKMAPTSSIVIPQKTTTTTPSINTSTLSTITQNTTSGDILGANIDESYFKGGITKSKKSKKSKSKKSKKSKSKKSKKSKSKKSKK
jgi:hypothetical protein